MNAAAVCMAGHIADTLKGLTDRLAKPSLPVGDSPLSEHPNPSLRTPHAHTVTAPHTVGDLNVAMPVQSQEHLMHSASAPRECSHEEAATARILSRRSEMQRVRAMNRVQRQNLANVTAGRDNKAISPETEHARQCASEARAQRALQARIELKQRNIEHRRRLSQVTRGRDAKSLSPRTALARQKAAEEKSRQLAATLHDRSDHNCRRRVRAAGARVDTHLSTEVRATCEAGVEKCAG